MSGGGGTTFSGGGGGLTFSSTTLTSIGPFTASLIFVARPLARAPTIRTWTKTTRPKPVRRD